MRNKRSVLIVFVLFFILGVFIMSYFQNIFQGTTMMLGVDLYPRWIGAQAILDLRAVYLNGDWNTFQKYLIRREQKQLYPNRSRSIESFQSPN